MADGHLSAELDIGENGLIPAIAQDAETGSHRQFGRVGSLNVEFELLVFALNVEHDTRVRPLNVGVGK